jgi:glutathione-dependent formaldehyde-activating enzyme
LAQDANNRLRTALVFVCLKDKVKIEGPTKSWAGTGSSGKPVHRIFCGQCGSPIAHDPDAAPEIIAMKGGTLSKEDKKALKPVRCGHPELRLYGGFSLSFAALRGPRELTWMEFVGSRDLDGLEAAFLPGAPRESFHAHARVII